MSKVFDSRTEVFSTDPEWGCFGFLDSEEIVMSMVVFGLSAGFFGNAGYTICLIFCSPVIVSAVFLVEPIIAQCFGWALGIDQAPGWFTWVGTCLVLLGIHQVHRAEALKDLKA